MFLPPLFGVEGAAADSNWLFGPLIVTFAVIAMADVVRPLRFANAALAALAAVAPFVVGAFDAGVRDSDATDRRERDRHLAAARCDRRAIRGWTERIA
jgi:hypothetical protein